MRKFGTVLVATLLTATLTAASGVDRSALHLRLVKSAPEADTQIESVSEVRLWFSQVPDAKATSIRITDAEGGAVETSKVATDSSDGRIQFASLDSELGTGQYTVAWRAMSPDGHVVRGEFGFEVMAR